ncbi:biliverdin reductase A-like [Pomacea canaliculata]|uniref:biliverdin reductase A-like n=1 Tax=Pomacea canaliculata TaxID=400727 RepID=UPI000D73FDB9|nr:biliverdin reductase A-like [Pomacea canaliculata]
MTSGFRTFGVVVVGIGTAGRVRLRDLQECGSTISLELKGFVSRHESEIPGVTKLSYEECLARSDIHAVIICTEPHTHENLIRQALYSNKHVLVEYPVALSSQIAQDLYQQANRKGLVLHEEISDF